ncbi:MAG: hypothetical protein ACO3T4_04685 [Candidatus Nanopelagicales bacterium]
MTGLSTSRIGILLTAGFFKPHHFSGARFGAIELAKPSFALSS